MMQITELEHLQGKTIQKAEEFADYSIYLILHFTDGDFAIFEGYGDLDRVCEISPKLSADFTQTIGSADNRLRVAVGLRTAEELAEFEQNLINQREAERQEFEARQKVFQDDFPTLIRLGVVTARNIDFYYK